MKNNLENVDTARKQAFNQQFVFLKYISQL